MPETYIDEESLKGLSPEERELTLKILNDIAKSGKSETYQDLLYEDYDEVPADIGVFLHNKNYLGNALYDADGRFTLFPYWEEKLHEIFPTNIDTAYNTVVLTGAIGIGKSTLAVICQLYMLYRLLCLKDPYLHYGMQPIDKISISFMNITLDAAHGVGGDKFNQMILSSPWFMSHGKMTGISNLEYIPEKHIEVIYGSSNNQIIGRALFCLDGKTQILTTDGVKPLEELVGRDINVISVDDNGKNIVSSNCTVQPTIKSTEEYQIELEDGTVIKCTPEHLLMCADGTYKAAKDLTQLDRLSDNSSIKSIKKVVLDEPKQFYDVIEAQPYHNFLIKTNSSYIVSHNCNFTDEVNFGLTSDVEKLKKKQKTLISQVDARMKSRFMRQRGDLTYLPTLNIIASSKNSEQSFLEDFIETKRKNESKNTLVVDEPQWVVDSRKDSKKKFQVAVGNRYLANELLPLNAPAALIDEYRAKGYNILNVPIGYLENFQENIDAALMDIAGIATASSMKYISGIRWNEIKTGNYENPFVKEIITVGDGKDDTQQYSDFFDLTKVPSNIKSKPLYIHLDLSKSGDRTGIGGVFSMEKRPTPEGGDASRDMFYRVAFHVGIQAPKGREISFDKSRTFIRWLREQGFNIKYISSDTFQSAQLQQQLSADGFEVGVLSVDRLDPETKQCLPYAYYKSTIYDRRIEVYDDCPELTEEMLGLERESDGHINHPLNGTAGCFTGDTKVSLTDGRELTMLELVSEYEQGKTNYVYSFNNFTKKIQKKPILKAWCTIRNAELVEVEISNGQKIRCTPNHRFMLYDGKYKFAKDLTSEDVLMPLYRRLQLGVLGIKYNPAYYEPFENTWLFEHQEFSGKYPRTLPEIIKAFLGRKNCIKKRLDGIHVISVKTLDTREDVYDLTIKDNHNFALSAGIFVHNSKDMADSICGALFVASKHADEFALDYGETYNTMVAANMDESEIAQQQLTVDYEEAMQEILDPVRFRLKVEEERNKEQLKQQQNLQKQQGKVVQNKQEDNKPKNVLMDFGMGKAQPLGGQFITDGILFW